MLESIVLSKVKLGQKSLQLMSSSDFLHKQTKLASICISEPQGQNWSIPHFRDFMTHLSHCTSLRTLKLRGLTVLSDAQTFEELVGLIPYLTELDLSRSVFKYSQFEIYFQSFFVSLYALLYTYCIY